MAMGWRRWGWRLRWRSYGTRADAKKPMSVLSPPTLAKQKILDLLKFRPIDFTEMENSLKKNAEKLQEEAVKKRQKVEPENRMDFPGRSLSGTLCKDAGIVKDGMLVTSGIREKDEASFFYLLISNFVLSSSTTEEVRMRFPKGVKVKIKHPRALYTAKGRVVLEVHNPMYMDLIGIELPDGVKIEEVWNEANKALEDKEFVRAVHLFSRCLEVEEFDKKMEAYSNRCQAWYSLGCYEIAYEDVKKAHYLDRDHSLTCLRKGHILSGLGTYRSAMTCFQLSGLADDSLLEKCAHLIEQKERGNYDILDFITGKVKTPEYTDYMGPVRIGMTSGEDKGRGLFATEDIRAGRVILVWNAAALASKEDMPTKLMRTCLQSRKNLFQFLGLDGTEILDMSLFKPGSIFVVSDQPYIWFDAVPAITNLCSSFTFQVDDKPESPMGLWTLPAFINHSCVPNVSQQLFGTALFVRAARDIRAEEELTLPYMDVKKPLDDRINWTMKRWKFTCRCMRCRVEARLHAHKSEFPAFYKRMKDAVKKKNVEELARIATEVEAQLAGLPSKVEMDWVRTSYYSAYRASLLQKSPGTTAPPVTAEQLMTALRATTPGYGIAKDLVALARSSASPESEVSRKSKSIIVKECVSVFGEQKPEFMDRFVDQLLNGVEFQIFKT